MPYYPKSQIKNNLYTNGNEFVFITTKKPYKGFYYLTSTGKRYTGTSPSYSTPSIELITLISSQSPNINLQNNITPINSIRDPFSSPKTFPLSSTPIETDEIIVYGENIPLTFNDLQEYSPKTNLYLNRLIPTYSLTLPTSQDRKIGSFKRYFCKKNNELKYIEINPITYTLLTNQDKNIAWDLYSPACVIWHISDNSEFNIKLNASSVLYIEQSKAWDGFSQYFKNKYSQYTNFKENSLTNNLREINPIRGGNSSGGSTTSGGGNSSGNGSY